MKHTGRCGRWTTTGLPCRWRREQGIASGGRGPAHCQENLGWLDKAAGYSSRPQFGHFFAVSIFWYQRFDLGSLFSSLFFHFEQKIYWFSHPSVDWGGWTGKKISMEGSKTEKRLLAGCPWEDGVPCGLHDTLVKCEGGDDGVAHRLHGGDMRQQGQPSMRHLPRKMPLAGLWHSHWVLAFPF